MAAEEIGGLFCTQHVADREAAEAEGLACVGLSHMVQQVGRDVATEYRRIQATCSAARGTKTRIAYN